jgi:hypothetical protein
MYTINIKGIIQTNIEHFTLREFRLQITVAMTVKVPATVTLLVPGCDWKVKENYAGITQANFLIVFYLGDILAFLLEPQQVFKPVVVTLEQSNVITSQSIYDSSGIAFVSRKREVTQVIQGICRCDVGVD